ncbi:MAG: hypothetical protein N4A49_11735 [Marinifilaceae bacterium]|jgi:hypothetical protein|nr:hypothetical protein [Marinifilaceae bacterium]
MKKLFYLLGLIFICGSSFYFVACDDDDDDDTDVVLTYEEAIGYLTDYKWVNTYTKATALGMTEQIIEDCDKDDWMKFAKDSTYTFNYGSVICSDSEDGDEEDYSGKYELSSDLKTLKMVEEFATTTYTIKKFTKDEIEMEGVQTALGIEAQLVVTFTRME